MRHSLKTLLLAGAATLVATGAYAEGYNKQSPSNNQSSIQEQSNAMEPAAGPMDSSNQSFNSESNINIRSASALDSDDIQDVQESLREQGHAISVDGVWGPETSAALRDFQQSNNLSATGNLDSETLSALDVDIDASAGMGASTTNP